MNDATKIIDLKSSGFKMPPEWHPHTATWMAWPHNKATWPHNLSAAQDEFLLLAAAISHEEPVVVIGESGPNFEAISALSQSSNAAIQVLDIPTNDAWIRDFGPTFCVNSTTKQLAAVDWRYNAWGGKYPPYEADQLAATRILEHPEGLPKCLHFQSDLYLEGGALEIDEDGLLLCTTSCAMNPNRNPNHHRSVVTNQLEQALGALHTLWLSGAELQGDDTDGHIDQQARFTPSGAILYAWTDSSDPQFKSIARNLDELRNGLRSANIQKELVPLPLPAPIIFQGSRLPASYCNFYITKRSVWVPQFDVVEDELALDIIGQHFPQHTAIGMPSRNLLAGLGSFHCLTQQQPMLSVGENDQASGVQIAGDSTT